MRINNNIMAMNAHRQYTINTTSVAKSTEKLSSGYRVNRAGDDAAGLAISEKMRAQIRGLTMASKNSNDAISLVQTAEGALQSAHNILQRMRELAVQSSSDTNEETIDRAALQQEFDQLKKELNDISTTTRFNDQNLLDGTFQAKISSVNSGATTLGGINNINVDRAIAGNYQMTVNTTPASPSETTDGVQVTADTHELIGGKVVAAAFDGLMTAKHNGNTYTMLVTGSNTEKMTFQLRDSNNNIVATAQNVNTSSWDVKDSSKNQVSFAGVGTFTFQINKEVTGAADVTALNGKSITFGESSGYTYEMGSVATAGTVFGGLTEIPADVWTYDMTGVGTAGVITLSAADLEQLGFASGQLSGVTAELDLSGLGDYVSNKDLTDGNIVLKYASGTIGGNNLTFEVYDSVNKQTLSTITVTGADLTNLAQTTGNPVTGTNGVTLAFIGALGTEDLTTHSGTSTPYVVAGIDAVEAQDGAATAEFGFTAYDNLFNSQTQISPAELKLTSEVNDAGDITFKLLDQNGATLAENSISAAQLAKIAPQGGSTTVQLGSYGEVMIKNADLGTNHLRFQATTPGTPIEETITLSNEKDNTSGRLGEDAVTKPSVRASMQLTINGETVNLYKGDTYANFAGQGIAFEFDALSDTDIAAGIKFGDQFPIKIGVNETNGKTLIIQTGANQGDELGINVNKISTDSLGLTYSNISNQASASQAITEVNKALNEVSTQRAALGALQNRLEHKISNLDTSAENLQAAESRIRDLDIAKEMTNFTRNNILVQASTAMLAQANAAPQGVLQLLQ